MLAAGQKLSEQLSSLSDEPMPVNTLMEAKSTGKGVCVCLQASSGLVESAQAMAVAGSAGYGHSLARGGRQEFWPDRRRISPKDAAVAAALPSSAKYSGQIVGAIAQKLGVTATRAFGDFGKGSAMTGAAGYLATIDESQIETLHRRT